MAEHVLLLDIGTTTISGALIDQKRNKLLASDSELNGQAAFGDDVITRIDFAVKNHANAKKLQHAAVDSINKLASRLSKSAFISKHKISRVLCVSNTAVHHLILGIDTTPLITPPYKAAQKAETTVYAERIGLDLNKDCPITFLPNIGGFVGSDALSVIISSGIYDSKTYKLAIDIGTNGEVALGNRDRIFVASTAAGPAFEGRHISCGMPAVSGAIESVKIRPRGVDIKVIGNTEPKGICGSGLIEAVFQMLLKDVMDGSGKMRSGEFVLYQRGAEKIFITQQDIRKIQLAKAAIYAAVRVLLRKLAVTADEISQVIITGSFGSTLDKEAVEGIGLIPHSIDKKRIRLLKHGALEGLKLYASKPALHDKILYILTKTKHIPLFGREFSEVYTSSMAMR